MRSSIVFGLSAGILSFAATAVARPDLNSFVNRKVSTTGDLVAQIEKDPAVADRYQRHFAMSKREVVSYVGSLHRDRLTKDGMYTIYSVPNDGRLKMHVARLKKGEPMFLDASGKPALIVKCGNPVTMGPLKARRGNPVASVPVGESGTRTMDSMASMAEESPASLLTLAPPVPEIPLAMTPQPPIVVEPEPLPPTVPATSLGGGSPFPWFLGLPALIPLFGSGGHHGTDSVPEPTSMLALGLGVVAIARRRKKA